MTATIESPIDRADALARLTSDGVCILRGLLPVELIERLHAAFMPIYRGFAAIHQPNRGPGRHYMDLPFAPPFADEAIYADPAVLALVDAMLGEDAAILHYGSDTPARGSQDQGLHSDLAELFPGSGVTLPPHALALNIPLVDMTPENGPFEGAPGTQRFAFLDGWRRIERGECPLQRFLLSRGDVMVRDPRMLHQGTANRAAEPRPMLVVAYQRPWYRHGDYEQIAICPALRESLSPRAAKLLRLHRPRPSV